MSESIGLTACRQYTRHLVLTWWDELCRVVVMFFTQTQLSEQFEVWLPLATQMHWPIKHY